MKTNAARILDRLKIAYELREYEVDPDDLGAERVAAGVGLPLTQVFKTLAARGDRNGVLLAAVAVSAGVRGMQMLLAPDGYLRATKAKVGPIARGGQ